MDRSMRIECGRPTAAERLHPDRRSLLWINAIGGAAVLASYALGLGSHPETRGLLWGDVPDVGRPFYNVNMLLAAAGYFPFAYFTLFALDPERTRFFGRFGYRLLHGLYAAMLVSAALWMPLTFAMLDAPSTALWWTIRATLGVTGLASLGLLAAIVANDATGVTRARRWAVVGCSFFCLQTAVLDALIWPVYFPV